MTPRPVALLCFLALSGALHAAPLRAQAAPAKRIEGGAFVPTAPVAKRPRAIYGTVPDTGQFLPDTVILARVNDRVIRVGEFVERYFNSYAEYRPRPDSAGRVEFLNNMINKEVLAIVARQAKGRETFEDRILMREHTQRVLSNVLFQRAVLDSVREPSEEEIRKIYAQLRYELRLQIIVMAGREQAERVRRDLAERRITWHDAAKRYSALPADSVPDGDLGWQKRGAVDPTTATAIFALEPGQISQVLPERAGYSIYRAAERRAIPPLSYEPMRSMIRDELQGLQRNERSERIMAALRAKAGMVHDRANLVWAASRFAPPVSVASGPRPVFDINVGIPHFEPEDTSRVLGRWTDGQITLGGFLTAYGAMAPLRRPALTNEEALRAQVDIFALEPYRADLARDRGLEKDSLTIALIEKRREELMVEHFYQDSILSKVWVPKPDRQKYYQEKIASFVTFPAVTYAIFHVDRKTEADSLAARLRGGEKAATILADSKRGPEWGAIEERRHDQMGTDYYQLLFEELKPGQVAVEGPDDRGHLVVIQSLTYDPGRQLSYEESEAIIDESLTNMAAEKLLNRILERAKRQARIVAHPELLMLVLLTDEARR
jgi:hypothetical protein